MNKITADFSKNTGKIKIMHSVNNGPAGSDVRGTSNLKYFREAGIPYARNHDAAFYEGYGGEHTVDVHRIFKNFDADENDQSSYDFEMTDAYMKRTEEAGVKTFYRLGARIEHEKKEGTFPPKDFGKWARICEHIIRHYNEGWANGFRMGIEYWEIWNEPDCCNPDGTKPCWQGTMEQFAEFFATVLKYLKTTFPRLKIGGPSLSVCENDENNKMIFDAIKAAGIIPDFFSFHAYTDNPANYYRFGEKGYSILKEYGLEGKTELILNEWNYVRGWLGKDYTYSIRSIKGLKGSSFIAGTMCTGQKSKLDHMMYYDARPSEWNSLFDTDFLTPLKGYYPFKMYNELYKMGNGFLCDSDSDCFYSIAAGSEDMYGIMFTYFDDNEYAEAKEAELSFLNLPVSENKPMTAEYFLLDEKNDMKLIRSEKITSKAFKTYLDVSLYSTYFIRISSTRQ